MTSFFCSLASDIYSFSSLSVIVELLIPCSYNCRLVFETSSVGFNSLFFKFSVVSIVIDDVEVGVVSGLLLSFLEDWVVCCLVDTSVDEASLFFPQYYYYMPLKIRLTIVQ